MKPDSLVNIFSVAKAVLSIGILRLVQDGKVTLDDSVCKHWPAFGKPEITVRHILTHQAGLANALPEEATLDTLLDWFGMREHMTKATPEHEPGTRTMYHYLTYCWLCGGIIEHVTGEHYDEYIQKILPDCDASDLHLGGLPNGMNHDELAVLSVYRPPVPYESTLKAVSRNDEESANTFEPANGETDNKEKKPSFKKVLAKYKGREQLLNPSVFNMKKVREAKLPSANVHASAASLARVLDSLSTDLSPLRPDLVKLARERPKNQITEQPGAQHQLLDDADSYFGLGFQVSSTAMLKYQSANGF
jgi:aarF domain-containing kinase